MATDDGSHGGSQTVCVTGASGYIGSHLIKQLLEKGYTVHGTVRDANDEKKVAWIRALADGTPGSLKLFSADLSIPGSFDAALEGCKLVCHVASVVKLKARNPKRDIVDPSIEGTRNVFDSIIKARSAERVVVTSSVAAMFGFIFKDKIYTEEDWTEDATVDSSPYFLSKVEAERLAWKVYSDQIGKGDGWKFQLVTILPGYVFGPILHPKHIDSSPQIILQLIDGTLPLIPDLKVGTVDVRDVALAHVLALENENAKGRYIVVSGDHLHLSEVANVVRETFPQFNVTRRKMPHWFSYVVSLVHPQISFPYLRQHLGKFRKYNAKKIEEELGIKWIDSKSSITETVHSLIDLGLAPKK